MENDDECGVEAMMTPPPRSQRPRPKLAAGPSGIGTTTGSRTASCSRASREPAATDCPLRRAQQAACSLSSSRSAGRINPRSARHVAGLRHHPLGDRECGLQGMPGRDGREGSALRCWAQPGASDPGPHTPARQAAGCPLRTAQNASLPPAQCVRALGPIHGT